MKLEKAIEIGRLYTKGVPKANHTDFEDALFLLIEAGKRAMKYRLPRFKGHIKLLPGETKD